MLQFVHIDKENPNTPDDGVKTLIVYNIVIILIYKATLSPCLSSMPSTGKCVTFLVVAMPYRHWESFRNAGKQSFTTEAVAKCIYIEDAKATWNKSASVAITTLEWGLKICLNEVRLLLMAQNGSSICRISISLNGYL